MNFKLGSVVIFTLINFLLSVVLIFTERKNPSTTWAWLLVFIILPPGVGFLLYILLGQNLSKQKIFDKKFIGDKFTRRLMWSRKNFDRSLSLNHQYEEYKDMILLHYNYSEAALTSNNYVEILNTGEEKFRKLLEEIDSAKKFIHVQYYIFKSDNISKTIRDALIKKAQEGVEVKLLYDAMGGRSIKKGFFKPLIQAGGKVSVFFPAIFNKIHLRMNFRNHRKLVIIDGTKGFLGGFNVGDEYLGLCKKFGYWRDTHLFIKGESVDDLEERFLLDWTYASKECLENVDKYFPTKPHVGNVAMQIVSSGPDSEDQQVKNGYLKMINDAKESIYIQTPYFVPDDSILEALKLACLSGVEVNIMIPSKPDHPFVLWASYSYLGELIKCGANVYTYKKGFIHCKTIVIDGKVSSAGTANMDIRSFKLNFEINAFIYNLDVSKNFVDSFKKDIEECDKITPEVYGERGIIIKFKESISRLLSPIL